MADVDRCVVCGAPVPEGRMVCWKCEHRADFTEPENCCREWEDAGGKEEALHGCKL
ncbi:MAG: hypothetical protein LUG47_05425 [Clostridiales bacterium]|nr:hypothetical protein [Clostridiales bacterium]